MLELIDADQYYQNGKFRQAIKIYKELLDKNPVDALAYQGLGRCYLHTSQIEEAYVASTKAFELDKHLTIPLITLASIYLKKNQLDDAEKIVQKALDIDPNQADAYIVLGRIKLNRDQIEESVLALHKAVELNSKSWQAHVNLATVYNQQKAYREALKEFWIAFRLSPEKIRIAYPVFLLSTLVYSTMYNFVIAALCAMAFILHSVFAWPLILISSGYSFFEGYLLIRSKKYGLSATVFLFGISLIVLYAYYIYALPPFSQ